MRNNGHGYVGTQEGKKEEDSPPPPQGTKGVGECPSRQGWGQIQAHCCYNVSLISFLPPSPALRLQWPLKLWPSGE